MADNLVYEESLNTEIDTSEFISKKWIYVNDNNNGNYTSQIVIDSTPLSNAGGYISWQEGFIVMPLLVQLTSGNAASLPVGTSVANWSWAFKSGFWNMINSMTVEFNNQNVIQQTPFLNVFTSFRANTAYSLDDLLNVGPTIGFYPDTPTSWHYNNNSSVATNTILADGVNIGFSNNTNFAYNASYNASSNFASIQGAGAQPYSSLPISDVAGLPSATAANPSVISYLGAQSNAISNVKAINSGMLTRQGWYNYNPINSNGQGVVNDSTGCQKVLRSFCDANLNTTQGNVSWQVYAKLRLKDLADFFEKMPLLKGSTIRFYINTNQSIVNFTTTAGSIAQATGVLGLAPTLTVNNVNIIGGLTCPLMIASNRFGNGASSLPADTYNLSVSIFRNNFGNQVNKQTTLSSCRLYAPIYYMNPLAESKYLSLTPTKRIMYNDVFQYQFNAQGTGNFNFLVSNGINNVQGVLVVPFISKTNTYLDAGGVATQLALSSTQNPCSSSPSMPDPIMITDFNILVSGVNLFLNNEQYDFEAFLEQLNQSNQLNGGLTTGLASGLISENAFSSGYRYYYGNASRTLPSEQGVSRSIQIVGNNVSTVVIDLMVFVMFQREITIDISTGARIE